VLFSRTGLTLPASAVGVNSNVRPHRRPEYGPLINRVVGSIAIAHDLAASVRASRTAPLKRPQSRSQCSSGHWGFLEFEAISLNEVESGNKTKTDENQAWSL